jgi:hypothetical protein
MRTDETWNGKQRRDPDNPAHFPCCGKGTFLPVTYLAAKLVILWKTR